MHNCRVKTIQERFGSPEAATAKRLKWYEHVPIISKMRSSWTLFEYSLRSGRHLKEEIAASFSQTAGGQLVGGFVFIRNWNIERLGFSESFLEDLSENAVAERILLLHHAGKAAELKLMSSMFRSLPLGLDHS